MSGNLTKLERKRSAVALHYDPASIDTNRAHWPRRHGRKQRGL